MAIEIGEMVVRASTGQAKSQGVVQPKEEPMNTSDPKAGDKSGPEMDEIKKVVLAECREMIFEILSDRKER